MITSVPRTGTPSRRRSHSWSRPWASSSSSSTTSPHWWLAWMTSAAHWIRSWKRWHRWHSASTAPS
ncbi:MAG: hypothetical protein EAY76_06950, partial [Alphaproteobacteria bacterium]